MSRQSELAQLGRVFDNSALSNRNVLINGNFDVWQRGTSGSSTVFFVADRWKNFGIGSSNSVSQQTFIVGQIDVPDEPQFFHRSVVTSSAGVGNLALTQQRIEDVRTFAGKTVTLSFWAKADSSKNIAVEFSQVFGAGGSAGVYGIGVQTCNLTSAWQKFTVTASLPSVSGKTIAASSSLDLDFWMDAGSDYNSRTNSLGQQSGTFDIAQVQLEVGDTATPFEHRSYSQELALCQRYLYRMDAGLALINGGSPNYSASLFDVYFPVTMRSAPTMLPHDITGYGAGSTQYRVYILNSAGGGFLGAPASTVFYSSYATKDKVRLVAGHDGNWFNSTIDTGGAALDVGSDVKLMWEAEL